MHTDTRTQTPTFALCLSHLFILDFWPCSALTSTVTHIILINTIRYHSRTLDRQVTNSGGVKKRRWRPRREWERDYVKRTGTTGCTAGEVSSRQSLPYSLAHNMHPLTPFLSLCISYLPHILSNQKQYKHLDISTKEDNIKKQFAERNDNVKRWWGRWLGLRVNWDYTWNREKMCGAEVLVWQADSKADNNYLTYKKIHHIPETKPPPVCWCHVWL